MKTKYTPAILCAVLVCSIVAIPQGIAFADASDSHEYSEKINGALAQYASAVEDAYANRAQSVFAPEIRKDSLIYQDSSIRKISSAQIEAKALDSHRINPTLTEVSVAVTTRVRLEPKDNSEIFLLGQKVDHLDSSSTDYHRMLMKSEDRSGDLVITHDVVLSDEEAYELDKKNTSMTVPEALHNESVVQFMPRSADDKFFTNSAGLNYLKAMQYAQLWTDEDHKDMMNREFPIYFGFTGDMGRPLKEDNNCTNFVSQALYVGGLPVRDNQRGKTDDKSWFYRALNGRLLPSHTWTGAENNYKYMRDYSGSFTTESIPWKAWEGSIIYFDRENDGKADHAMIVVGYWSHGDKSEPIICQKSTNRHDFPFSQSYENAKRENPNVTWKVLQYKFD